MGKVDCVTEAIEERANARTIEIATNFLRNSDISLEEISENTGLPLEKVIELKNSL